MDKPLALSAVAGIYLWGYGRCGNRALLFLAVGLGIWALSSLIGEVYVLGAGRLLGPPSASTAVLTSVTNSVFLLTNLMSLLGAIVLLIAARRAVQRGHSREQVESDEGTDG